MKSYRIAGQSLEMYVEYKIHKSKYLDIYVFPYDLFTTSVESVGCFRINASLFKQKCSTNDSMAEWVGKNTWKRCFLIECYFSCRMIFAFQMDYLEEVKKKVVGKVFLQINFM